MLFNYFIFNIFPFFYFFIIIFIYFLCFENKIIIQVNERKKNVISSYHQHFNKNVSQDKVYERMNILEEIYCDVLHTVDIAAVLSASHTNSIVILKYFQSILILQRNATVTYQFCISTSCDSFNLQFWVYRYALVTPNSILFTISEMQFRGSLIAPSALNSLTLSFHNG